VNRLESELFDLEECLMRNDGMADGGTYSTIVRIANEVSELESENAKLREACAELLDMAESHDPEWLHWPEMYEELRKLGVKV
jgi:hypothetical protein